MIDVLAQELEKLHKLGPHLRVVPYFRSAVAQRRPRRSTVEELDKQHAKQPTFSRYQQTHIRGRSTTEPVAPCRQPIMIVNVQETTHRLANIFFVVGSIGRR